MNNQESYYNRNKDKFKQYYMNNKDRIKEYATSYYNSNKDKIQQYYKTHKPDKERKKEYNNRYNAKKTNKESKPLPVYEPKVEDIVETVNEGSQLLWSSMVKLRNYKSRKRDK